MSMDDGYSITVTRSGGGVITSKPCIVKALRVIDANASPAVGMVQFSDGNGGAPLWTLSIPVAQQYSNDEHVFGGMGHKCAVGVFATVTGIGTAVLLAEIVEAG